MADQTTCRGCGGTHFANESICPRTKRPIADGAFDSMVGPYHVGKLLGAGGFGAVHLAVDTRNGTRVALKLLHPELVAEPELLDRFVREAEVTVRAGNPHIVRVLEASFGGPSTDGSQSARGRAVFVALELLAGDTLSNVMRAGPLTATRAVDIAVQALDGLAVAHAAGVIHRDIKPANLFLADDGDEPRSLVKILDFGIGRLLTGDTKQRLTLTGTQLGTPHFMAPEQVADSKRADARADLYAVAVTMFAMLTGERPYGQVSVGDWLGAVARGEPARRAVSPIESLPATLVEVIATGLAVDPARRFQDAGAFARALLDAVPDSRATTRALPALAVTSAFTLPPTGGVTVRAKRGAQAIAAPVIAGGTSAGGAIAGGAIAGGAIAGGAIAGGTSAGGAIAGGTIAGGTSAGGAIAGGAIAGSAIAGGAIADGAIAGGAIAVAQPAPAASQSAAPSRPRASDARTLHSVPPTSERPLRRVARRGPPVAWVVAGGVLVFAMSALLGLVALWRSARATPGTAWPGATVQMQAANGAAQAPLGAPTAAATPTYALAAHSAMSQPPAAKNPPAELEQAVRGGAPAEAGRGAAPAGAAPAEAARGAAPAEAGRGAAPAGAAPAEAARGTAPAGAAPAEVARGTAPAEATPAEAVRGAAPADGHPRPRSGGASASTRVDRGGGSEASGDPWADQGAPTSDRRPAGESTPTPDLRPASNRQVDDPWAAPRIGELPAAQAVRFAAAHGGNVDTAGIRAITGGMATRYLNCRVVGQATRVGVRGSIQDGRLVGAFHDNTPATNPHASACVAMIMQSLARDRTFVGVGEFRVSAELDAR